MYKRFLPVILTTLVSCEKPAPPPKPPPPTVLVSTITAHDVPVYVENIGRTQADKTVEIRARVTGFLEKSPFKEGTIVKKGDLLFQIEQAPYLAAVDIAKAAILKAQASQIRAHSETQRLRPLSRANAISKQEFDNADATEREAQADVASAQAQLIKANLDLSYTTMIAPFDGMVSARQVDVGNYVGALGGDTLLATISTTEPVRVVLHIPETDYIKFQKRFLGNQAAAQEHSDAIDFELILNDGTTYPYKGKFNFADRSLDASTGTLKIEIDFPNPDLLLRPGQFARVRSKTTTIKGAILVPQRAVVKSLSSESVLVIGKDNKVESRTITTDVRYEDYSVVSSGLKAGETVVVEGIQKALPGIIVNPQPYKEAVGSNDKSAAASAPQEDAKSAEPTPDAKSADGPPPAAQESPKTPEATSQTTAPETPES